jgi:hypothetical protein
MAKKYIMKSLRHLYIVLFTLTILSCDESLKFPPVSTGIVPTVEVNTAQQVFDLNNKATTAIQFTLNYNNFGGALSPDTIFIHAASGAALNSTLNFANARLLKYYVNFPADVSVSLAEVCQTLGIDITKVTNIRSFELFFTVKTQDGTIYREGTNVTPGVVSTNHLGYYRYRFFGGCKTGIEEGYYQATISGNNRLNIKTEKEVKIASQTIVLDGGNAYLNFMRDIVSITDITAGFYPQSGLNPTLISNQPLGIRDECGTLSLFNEALLTLPSPSSQLAFDIKGGSWDPATKTLTVKWTDAKNNISETTTFVKVRDL